MNTFMLDRIQEKKFEGINHRNPEHVRKAFESSDQWKHMPSKKRALCLINAPTLTMEELLVVLESDTDEDYKDAVLRNYSARNSVSVPILAEVLENNPNCGMKPGIVEGRLIDVTIAGATLPVELPEVMVWSNNKPYIRRMKEATDKRLEITLFKTLCFVYRLGLDDREVVTIAIERGVSYSDARRLQYNAATASIQTKTIAELYMVNWFKKAVKHCVNWNQVDILVRVYVEAVMFGNAQPVISKQRLAERVGTTRQSVIRLFQRLEKAGVLVEGPVTFKSDQGFMKNARIVNLNPDNENNRWVTHTPEASEVRPYVDSQGSFDSVKTGADNA